MAAPKAEIDHEALREAYLRTGSQREAAAALGVTERTLNRRRKTEPDLARVLDEARQEILRLRRENRPHGRTRYNEGCRCEECKRANRESHRQAQVLRLERPFKEVPHGINGYRNYGCRCPVCTEANRIASRNYRQGQKGVA